MIMLRLYVLLALPLAVCLALALPAFASAQDDDSSDDLPSSDLPSSDLPVLPDTEVEADPDTTDGGGQDFFDETGPSNIVTDGSVFDSGPVDGYRAESSTSGSIIDLPDADLPATVNVIPRDVLDDQISLDLTDVIRNAGGTTPAGDILFPDRIFLRGLEVGSRNFRKDGFLDPTFVPRDFQNVERVEILKGPASVLYGSGDPAGIVNVITKSPVLDRFADFGFTFGSFEQSRFVLDANGYTRSGNVLYRLNAAQEDRNSFVDFEGLTRTQISPAVTWLLDDDTSLTWKGEWHRHNTLGFQGTPAVSGDPLFLPPSTYLGEPANDFFMAEEFRQSLVLRRQINDDWWYRIGGYSLFYDFPNSTTAAAVLTPAVLPPTFFERTQNDGLLSEEESHSMIANLAGEFCLGGFLHKALFGVEYTYFDSATSFASNGLFVPIDGAAPVYTDPPGVPLFSADFPVFRQEAFGGYLQDIVELTPTLQLMGGVRFDTLDFQFERDVGFGPVETDETFDNVAPRGGIVYQPFADESLAFYYSYARSFVPPSGGVFLNSDILPIVGETHESGVKAELIDGLSLTAAGFFARRENDAFNLTSITLVQVGEVRSQGAELNLIGDITDAWSIIANYTYTDAVLSDPDPTFDGNRARNVPYNSANLWTRYDFYCDCCQTMGAALGLVYLGNRPADLENDLFLPGFTRWDAGVYYRRGQLGASVYLENLFDIQYAASSVNELQIFQGAPFNVRATLQYYY
ncbi:MAG: TonB-dependent siderophore receptor [Planctomycetota bacterium]|nr:MAG: TonB-dependent siderophore receptor [Planctomycetota bacterium]